MFAILVHLQTLIHVSNTSELVSPSHNDETNASLLSLNCSLYDSIQLSKSTIHDLRFVSLYITQDLFSHATSFHNSNHPHD